MAAGPPQPLLESSSYNHHQMESSIVFGDQSDRAWQRELSGASGLAAQPVGRRCGPERCAASLGRAPCRAIFVLRVPMRAVAPTRASLACAANTRLLVRLYYFFPRGQCGSLLVRYTGLARKSL